MQTAPGLIHSTTDFFVTNAGIVGTETTIADFFPFDPAGVPEFARVRRAMQDASSIEEWCEIMKKGNNGGYANSWLLGDIKTNEIARFVIGLKYVGFTKKKDGYFSGSNIAEDLKILRRETRTNEINIKMPNVARQVRWNQLMKEYAGKIDIETGKVFLSDHFDTYTNIFSPDSRTICGHFELDAQVSGTFEPFLPLGAYDGKVVDASMAKNMSFVARWGSPCGIPFYANKFLEEHPQFDWMNGLLKDRPTQPWTTFKAGEKK
jgi:transposase